MLLAYGQIPDASRPALSWPTFSLVGIVPVSGGPGLSRRLSSRRPSKPYDSPDQLTIEEGVEPDFPAVTIIDRKHSPKGVEDEELMLILELFVIAEDN